MRIVLFGSSVSSNSIVVGWSLGTSK